MKVTRLVKKAQKGNKKALLKLITEQQSDYYRLAYSYVLNEHDAKDAMSEMVVTLYNKISYLKNSSSFYSWSKTILVNHCKDLLRDRNKVIPIENAANEAMKHSDEIDETLKMEMESLLTDLNDVHKEAIILKYVHDYTYEMVAEIMEVSVGTAKSRVF